MEDLNKEISKEPKEYVSVSTRLPNVDAITLQLICKRQNTTPSEYIRELIQKGLSSPKSKFLAGKNKIKYDKTTNSFSWLVELDSGEEAKILNNLSDDFLKNLQTEIQEAIKERNEWVHQIKEDSVHISNEILGEEK